jgi:hypothetical protein
MIACMADHPPVRRVAPTRLSAATAAAALVLAGAAGPAAADAPWSAPQPISGASLLRWEPQGAVGASLKEVDGVFAFTPSGVGLAVLGHEAGGRGIARLNGAGTAFGPLTSSPLGGVAPTHMATYGRDGVLLAGGADAVGDPRSPLNADTLLDAAVTRGTTAGAFARRQVLAEGVARGSPSAAVVTALAANASGDAAAVVSVPVRGRRTVIGQRAQLFVRRRGQSRFVRRIAELGERTLGRSPAALAVNGPGDVLVAWDDRESVWSRVITSRGRICRAQRLGRGGAAFVYGGRMAAAMDARRRAIVAWVAQRVAGETASAGPPGTVSFAYAPPARRFGRAQVVQRRLPTGPDRGIRGPGVGVALLRDRAVLVWTGAVAGRHVIRAVDVISGRARNGAGFSAPGAEAQLRGLAAGPRGLVAVWSTAPAPLGPPFSSTFQAVARAPTAQGWGPVETIAATATGSVPAADAPLAAHPVSGQVVLVWSDPAGQARDPIPVRSSTRPAPVERRRDRAARTTGRFS